MLLWNEKNGKGREDTLNDGIAERIRIREKKKKMETRERLKGSFGRFQLFICKLFSIKLSIRSKILPCYFQMGSWKCLLISKSKVPALQNELSNIISKDPCIWHLAKCWVLHTLNQLLYRLRHVIKWLCALLVMC